MHDCGDLRFAESVSTMDLKRIGVRAARDQDPQGSKLPGSPIKKIYLNWVQVGNSADFLAQSGNNDRAVSEGGG